jgi:hypothetical protein
MAAALEACLLRQGFPGVAAMAVRSVLQDRAR